MSGRIARILSLAVLLSLVLALGAACGNGDDDDEPEPTATLETDDTGETPTAVPTTDSVTLDVDFWHGGWKVTLGDATLGPDDTGIPTVAIDARFENLSAGTGTFNSQLALVSGGNAYGDTTRDHELPNVPGGLTGNGMFAIRVDESFMLDDATLIIGNPNNNQATVPIGPNSPDELVTLEPLQLDVTGSSEAGLVAFTVTGVEVRADFPDTRRQVEAGRLALTVSFEVTPSAGIPLGEGVFQRQNVALMLPDGTAVAVHTDGRSGVNELLQGRSGTTITDLSVRFLVPSPPEGEYAFIVRGPYSSDREMMEGEVTFEVPEY